MQKGGNNYLTMETERGTNTKTQLNSLLIELVVCTENCGK